MTGARGQTNDRATSLERYARFLARQANEAGLTTRAIAERFCEEVRRQEETAAAAGKTSQHPITSIRCSKSTIDRVLKAKTVPRQPRLFTRHFLIITSKAAGLSQQEHERRWAQALELLAALSEDEGNQQAQRLAAVPAQSPEAQDVARLRLEVDLERSRHTETRLTYVLRDTRLLVTTLWDIIGALREILSGNDATQARLISSTGASADGARVQSETQRALNYKRAAQAEADQALARLRVLEECWERARAETRRLSLLSDAVQISTEGSASSASALTPLPPQELLAQPALNRLDDIKAALDKVRLVNAREEATTIRTLQETVGQAILGSIDGSTSPALSDREKQAMKLIASGMPYKWAARQLQITEATLRTYLKRIKDKYQLAGRPVDGLIPLHYAALRDGIITDPAEFSSEERQL
ncbi:LuxR C-terminal-related transcriptional regulator [Streptomyces sp. NPDC057680]|uniref:helix-turn-helix transcriptional regulator n=1 Tax=Streptomyces sp. NPDC057680 TaxID=3346208 RepID=UPI0036B42004